MGHLAACVGTYVYALIGFSYSINIILHFQPSCPTPAGGPNIPIPTANMTAPSPSLGMLCATTIKSEVSMLPTIGEGDQRRAIFNHLFMTLGRIYFLHPQVRHINQPSDQFFHSFAMEQFLVSLSTEFQKISFKN